MMATSDTEPTPFFANHELGLSLYDRNVLNIEYPKKLPLFWEGQVKLQHGMELSYRKQWYHSKKRVSLDWGINLAAMRSRTDRQSLFAVSLFPSIRIWLFRYHSAQSYFSYTVAGPSYISKDFVDNTKTGRHFTFYDALNLGFIFGEKHNIDIGLEMAHYSNGNLFSQNPGFCVPLSLHLGYLF
jgi:hypothetical protein